MSMKSGLLKKKSSGWFPRWQTRHVTHSAEKTLTMRRDTESGRCRVFLVASANQDNAETEFSVTCHDGRILHLRSRSKSDREAWLAALTVSPAQEAPALVETSFQPVAKVSQEELESTSGSRYSHSGRESICDS